MKSCTSFPKRRPYNETYLDVTVKRLFPTYKTEVEGKHFLESFTFSSFEFLLEVQEQNLHTVFQI